MPKVFIIAEAGVNHNGSLATARKMVDAAAKAGADAVKFQTFMADALVSVFAPKAGYQVRATGKGEGQLDMIRRLELDQNAHERLIEHCHRRKIMFLSSPFDLGSIDRLSRLGMKLFKIPSGEITNLPYLRKIGSLRKKVILSTGMSTLREIKEAVAILSASGTNKNDITVLHCNTEYPTPYEDVNLRAMGTIRKELGVKVGYSDHTLGTEISVAAVALGACVIEKHFTLDRDMPGPDHRASLEPHELKALVHAVRHVSAGMGDGIKRPSSSEAKNISMARKHIVALDNIHKGDVLSERNITVKRCGSGLSAMQWDKVLGKTAKKHFKKDELISL